jgi:hypothetical protein
MKMKQFKEDKQDLEMKIAEMINEFCKKYDVKIEDINVEWLGYYNGDNEYKIKVDVKL